MDIETTIQFISRAKLTIIDYNPDKLFWEMSLLIKQFYHFNV